MKRPNSMKVVNVLSFAGLIALLALGVFSSGCSGVAYRQELVDSLFLYLDDAEIYYQLKEPDKKFSLPYALSEVSGVSYKAPQSLLMIEDEAGLVYEFDMEKEEVVHSIRFARPGDFEDIELLEDTIYALRSDGRIFKLPYTSEKEIAATELKTPLRDKNNTEGLGYDPVNNKLLITTKEDGDYEGHNVKGRAVFAFDRRLQEMDPQELFAISNDDLETFFERVKKQGYDKNRFKFDPSAIAYNPLDGNYYVLASVGKLLLVVNRKGEIESSYPILPRILNQPEGICFAPNGDMFICSEGEGDRGFVLQFKMHRK